MHAGWVCYKPKQYFSVYILIQCCIYNDCKMRIGGNPMIAIICSKYGSPDVLELRKAAKPALPRSELNNLECMEVAQTG